MKFLFFTDTHIRGTNPRNRKDNFYEALKEKFREIVEISKEHNVDYILHGGDWFDRPDISPAIVREFALIIRQFEKPIYTVAGNHDIYGQNPQTIGRTMLGLLEGIDLMKIIKNDEYVFLKKDGITVQLTGKSYTFELDGQDFGNYYIIDKKDNVDYAVNIIHGMLLSKPFFEGIQYTLIEDIVDTKADITLAGHYHSGFGIKEVNSKFFVNPGSIVRISNSINEINRQPEIIIIELNERINIMPTKLKSAKAGEEVLDRTKLENSQNRILNLHQFYKGLESNEHFKRININDIIEEISHNTEISIEVREEAIRRIASARESLAKGDEDL